MRVYVGSTVVCVVASPPLWPVVTSWDSNTQTTMDPQDRQTQNLCISVWCVLWMSPIEKNWAYQALKYVNNAYWTLVDGWSNIFMVKITRGSRSMYLCSSFMHFCRFNGDCFALRPWPTRVVRKGEPDDCDLKCCKYLMYCLGDLFSIKWTWGAGSYYQLGSDKCVGFSSVDIVYLVAVELGYI